MRRLGRLSSGLPDVRGLVIYSELTLTPIPIDILRAAVSRLDNYTEDVRVEVEIGISDEEVLAKGYEVLLCFPGALSSADLRLIIAINEDSPRAKSSLS
jgi:hypothetical protein